jgi:hypothetical protein
MSPRLPLILSALSLAGCAALQGPDPSNTAAYCTADNAFRLGSQARAYLGGCPKEAEGAFLAGLMRGRALVPPTPQAQPYLTQMTELEKQLLAAGSEVERERIRTRLRDAEWWAVHIINSPGSYSVDGA